MADSTQPNCHSICSDGCDAGVAAFSHLPDERAAVSAWSSSIRGAELCINDR